MSAILLAIIYQLVIFPNVVTIHDPMVDKINYERTVAGVEPLIENKLLDQSAKAKACDMVEKKYWSHYSPDGVSPWKFIEDAGYKYITAGENLIRNVESDEDGMRLIMNSVAHKNNVLKPTYKNVGIGRCGNIIVQHFGRQ